MSLDQADDRRHYEPPDEKENVAPYIPECRHCPATSRDTELTWHSDGPWAGGWVCGKCETKGMTDAAM